MRKTELIALRARQIPWSKLEEALPALYEQLGIAVDNSAKDGTLTIRDHGHSGCVLILENGSLARRAATALSTRFAAPVQLFEVIGSAGEKAFKFRTEALLATPQGALNPAEGVELDLDDPEQSWGGGDLDARAQRVLRDFGELEGGSIQTRTVGYKRRSAGRPSTPRVATLLSTLQKAQSFEGVPQPNGRIELRMELAAGGRQTSFCTAAEFEEVQRLLGGKRR
jgi:hypothetical protein